jgi:hypothetical protein
MNAVIEQFFQQFHSQITLRHFRTSSRNSSDSKPMFGLSSPASANTSSTPVATTALSRILLSSEFFLTG